MSCWGRSIACVLLVFGTSSIGAEPGDGQEDVRLPACQPPPRLRLAGTTKQLGIAAPRALIENLDSNRQAFVDLNGFVAGYRLSAIDEDSVVLTRRECAGEVRLKLDHGVRERRSNSLDDALTFEPPSSTHISNVRSGSILASLGLR